MCLIISAFFSYLSYTFYVSGDITNAIINGIIAILFIILLVRNILKTVNERKNIGN